MLVFVWIVTGCSPGQLQQKGPKESFRPLISEFKDRAAKKMTDGLTITVTEQLAADRHPAEAATATIQVRKQTPGGVPGNVRKTAEVIDLYFVYETNRWRCSKAMSKDLEGDKIVGQNSLGGPDIGLTNLFIWIGL